MAVEKAATFRVNDLVFVPDSEEMYVPGQVITEFTQGAKGTVRILSSNSKMELKEGQSKLVERMDAQSYKDVPDMISLKMLNVGSLLHNLKLRYFKEPRIEIYTNIGAILVALNPFEELGLYSSEMEEKYLSAGQSLADTPPHIFKVAEMAMENMRQEDMDQSCVITGESGAGKTENTKRFLQYVSERSRRNREAYGGEFGVDTELLRQQILDSNPFLEAFGNAKTLRNDNSSRFGKLIELSFETSKGVVVAASITNYLLEKSRVVKVGAGERNYHIFYQICAATKTHTKFKKDYHLQTADMFNYCLGENKTLEDLKIEGENDAQVFEDTRAAMAKLNLSDNDIDVTFRICSAILHIGNIEFQGQSKDLAELKEGVEQTALAFGAELLGVGKDGLAKAILERKLIGSTVKQHTVQEAEAARDALSKFVYEKLFDWLVMKMNQAMAQEDKKQIRKKSGARVLAVLDIFGFETFEVNSFEQLCINYCNERLQAFFNLHVFRKEQQEYQEEGIDVEKIGFYDNRGVINAITGNAKAVIVILDDCCNLESANDQGFLQRVLNNASEMKNSEDQGKFLFKPKVQQIRKRPHLATSFAVKHFAGFVFYNVENFIEKNKDQLRKDIRMLLADSKMPLVSGLFPDGGDGNAGKQAKYISTLGKKFTGSLQALMKRLDNTTPQFVRCIKPNDEKKPSIFTAAKVYKQMNEAGLVEVCKIRKLGYPIKKTLKDFYSDYKCIVPSAKGVNDLCEALVKQEILFETNRSPNWQVGKTRVFMRSEQLYILEKRRGEALKEVLSLIFRFVKHFLRRRRLLAGCNARIGIKQGIKNKDPKLLQKSLEYFTQKGSALGKIALVEEGLTLMKVLRAQLDELEALKVAISEKDMSTIKVRLEVIKDYNLEDDETVMEARKMLANYELETKVLDKLQSALREQTEEDLAKAVEFAIESGFGKIKACKQAEKMLKTVKERNMLIGLLRKALEAETSDPNELKRLVDELRALGLSEDDELIKEAAKKGKLVLQARKEREKQIKLLEKNLVKYIAEGNYEKLQECVEASVLLHFNGDLVKQAMDMVQNLRQRQGFLDEVSNASRVLGDKARLPKGITEKDLKPLQHAIKSACEVPRLELQNEIQVKDGKKLLLKMEEQLQVQDELDVVLQENNVKMFYKILEKVQALGLQTRNADILVQKVKEMEMLTAKSDAITNEAQTKDILDNLVSPNHKQRQAHLRNRIKEMQSKSFMKMANEIWESNQYGLANYYKVRSDADYLSKEEPRNKEERKNMKFAYEGSTLLTKSLLEMNDFQEARALSINKTLVRLCEIVSGGKRETMESGMIFIASHGIADPTLGDEIYIQLAKHLTANPNALSKRKAWHLFCLCTTFFAPSERFLPYVLSFLHNTSSDVGLEGNYARYSLTQVSASMAFNPTDINFKPTKKEVKAFFERPPVLLQLAVVNGGRVDIPVPPDYTLSDAAKIIRAGTNIMIDLNNPEWSIFLKATSKPPKLTYKTRLENFYRVYKPQNLGSVDEILAYYKGHEEGLFRELVKMEDYGPEPTPVAVATRMKMRGRSKSNASKHSKGGGEKGNEIDDLLGEEETKSMFSVASKSSIASAVSKVGSVVSRMFRRARGYSTVNIQDIDIPNPQIPWPCPWWEYIGDVVNDLYEQDLIPIFTYKRRLYKVKGRADDDLYAQLKADFLDGITVPQSQTDVALLSVLLLGVKLVGKSQELPTSTNGLVKAGIQKFIPRNLRRKNRKNLEWFAAFTEVAALATEDLKGAGKAELIKIFFERMRKIPAYGMSFFSGQLLKQNAKSYIAKAQTDSTEGIIKIGINQFELALFKEGEEVSTFALESIKKVLVDGQTVTFKVAKGKKLATGAVAGRQKIQKKKTLRERIGDTVAGAVRKVIKPRMDTVQIYTLQPKEIDDLIKFFQNLPSDEEE